MDWKFSRMRAEIDRCLRDSMVFAREGDGGTLIEAEICRYDRGEWLVVAAGISPAEGKTFFPVTGNRATRATTPLSVAGSGTLALLLVIRPKQDASDPARIATFSREIPLIELRTGYLRLADVDRETIRHVRWECDVQTSENEPLEKWLSPWKGILGFNPAHAPSHLHLNSPPLLVSGKGRSRQEHDANELRLAVGVPNPLSLVLSLAAWLRRPG